MSCHLLSYRSSYYFASVACVTVRYMYLFVVCYRASSARPRRIKIRIKVRCPENGTADGPLCDGSTTSTKGTKNVYSANDCYQKRSLNLPKLRLGTSFRPYMVFISLYLPRGRQEESVCSSVKLALLSLPLSTRHNPTYVLTQVSSRSSNGIAICSLALSILQVGKSLQINIEPCHA